MKVVVCVKQVPDTAANIAAEDGQANWGDASLVINPWDEYAVETALNHGDDVTVITMGNEESKEALKHALAMGCNQAVLVSDPALINADSQVTAKVLAAAIRNVGDVDLIVFGRQAVDGDGGVTAAQTARVLGFPMLSLAASVEIGAGVLKVERSIEEGRQQVEASLPAAISVVKDIGEPRYPSFMGIRKAARADIPTWTLADLDAGALESVVAWPDMMNPPARDMESEIIEGADPAAIASSLADRILAEKVL